MRQEGRNMKGRTARESLSSVVHVVSRARRTSHVILALGTAVAIVGPGSAATSSTTAVREFVNVYPLSATSKRVVLYNIGADPITRFRFRGDGFRRGFEITRLVSASATGVSQPTCRLTETIYLGQLRVPTIDCSVRLGPDAKLILDIDVRAGGGNAADNPGCYDVNAGTPTQTPRTEFGVCASETRGPAPPKTYNVAISAKKLSATTAQVTILNRDPQSIRRFEVDLKGARLTKILSVKISGGRRTVASTATGGVRIKGGDAYIDKQIAGQGGKGVVVFARSGKAEELAVHFDIGSECRALSAPARTSEDCSRRTKTQTLDEPSDPCAELKVRVAQLTSEVAALKAEIERLQKEIKGAEDELRFLEGDLAQFPTAMQAGGTLLPPMIRFYEELQRQISSLQSANSFSLLFLVTAKEKLEKAERALAEAKRQLEECLARRANRRLLMQQEQSCDAKATASGAARGTVDALQFALAGERKIAARTQKAVPALARIATDANRLARTVSGERQAFVMGIGGHARQAARQFRDVVNLAARTGKRLHAAKATQTKARAAFARCNQG